MLDLKLFEDQKEMVEKKFQARNLDRSILDNVNNLNKTRKALTTKVEGTKADVNKKSKEIGELKKNKQNADALMQEVVLLKKSMEADQLELEKTQDELNNLMLNIPNLISDETPLGKDETQNKEIKKWGTPRTFDFKPIEHSDLGEKLGLLDFEIAGKITGARFVVYKGALARMERALANFMIDHHLKKNYQEILPPFIAHERSLVGTGNLPKFKDQLFKIEDHDWYLIPTAEVPVTNLKRDQIFEEKEFPLKYVAYTPCFRSEAGSHGKDTKGLIRMHQFNKVEMVNITHPEDSKKVHQEMIASACEILELLGLPYRAVALCSGDIGFASRATVDLEVWIPTQSCYREISSISNCGDFQARRANIRFRNKEGKPEFAHTLNGSGLAVGRTLVAIMENYQQADGSIKIPEVLWPYMGNLKEIRA